MATNIDNGMRAQIGRFKAANDAYNAGTRKASKCTFRQLREQAKAARAEIQAAKAIREKELQMIREKYLPNVSQPYIDDANARYNDVVNTTKEALKEQLNAVKMEKAALLQDYIMTAPTQDALNLLQTFSYKAGNIGEAELKMFITRFGDNYQAVSALQAIAKKAGYDIKLPVDPEAYTRELDTLAERYSEMIDRQIESDDAALTYQGNIFFNYDDTLENAYFSDAIRMMDDAPAFTEDAPKPTIMQRLREAQAEAMEKAENGDGAAYKKVKKIGEFVRFNMSSLMDPDELHEYKKLKATEEAEELLSGEDQHAVPGIRIFDIG